MGVVGYQTYTGLAVAMADLDKPLPKFHTWAESYSPHVRCIDIAETFTHSFGGCLELKNRILSSAHMAVSGDIQWEISPSGKDVLEGKPVIAGAGEAATTTDVFYAGTNLEPIESLTKDTSGPAEIITVTPTVNNSTNANGKGKKNSESRRRSIAVSAEYRNAGRVVAVPPIDTYYINGNTEQTPWSTYRRTPTNECYIISIFWTYFLVNTQQLIPK
ncbi:hypothetical protein BTUL_0033g00260 [Botrytis tulipae]|uniref:Uncharacterized protein n=1 Tax=Botrytis tulipae TaxID=87230 RepID=A0A4Z1EXV4_9HELO|nr:hypothetical protein BTUL_0033g00260 [Botrytis tulipae]